MTLMPEPPTNSSTATNPRFVLAGKSKKTSILKLLAPLGSKLTAGHDKYLGVPLTLGRSKAEVFGYIEERVWNKIKG